MIFRGRAPVPWPEEPRERRAWLRDHLRFSIEATLHLVEHLVTTFFVMLLIGVSIALPAGLWVVKDYLSYADLVWPAESGFNVFFSNEATDEQINATAKTIRNHALVSEVFLIPKSTALREFLTAADLPNVAEGLTENPLPNALTVYVKEDVQTQEIEQLTEFIEQFETIDQVSYDAQIISRFNAIQAIFNRLQWVVAATFCLFSLFVSASAVRIAIETRVHELRILYVIGSPQHIARGPFLWSGFLYGTLGGIFASVLLTLVLIYLEEPLRSLTASYGVERNLENLSWLFVASVWLTGSLIGLGSAFYATWRHLQRITMNWAI